MLIRRYSSTASQTKRDVIAERLLWEANDLASNRREALAAPGINKPACEKW